MSATYEVRGNVAVITLDNPPVNGLGYETRKGITDGLAKATDDAAVKAIVITGAGKAFSGGADIREFGTPKIDRGAEPAVGDPRHRSERQAGGRCDPQRRAWAAGSSLRSAATTASSRPARRSHSPKSRSA